MSSHSFFFNDTATTEIYTLSLHDALPISRLPAAHRFVGQSRRTGLVCRSRRSRWLMFLPDVGSRSPVPRSPAEDRKSTRLNSSHANISYAVFCLKKKNHFHLPLLSLSHHL